MSKFDGTVHKQGYLDSDGSIVVYQDDFVVTKEEYDQAEGLEEQILVVKQTIDRDFLVLGNLLSEFEQIQGYKAKGFTSFKLWADSPHVGISYRVAHDLIRITRELLPVIGEQPTIPSISQLRELLPVLSDTNPEVKVKEAYERIQDLTVRDAREEIKDIRGISRPIDEAQPALYFARVRRGDVYHIVDVSETTGNNTEFCGRLRIRRENWPRWEQRFGAFVQIIE